MNLPSKTPSLSDSPLQPPPHNTFPFVKGECCNCGIKERWLLHNVVVRGVDRRICTSCVLRLHPSSFCPCCFEFYDNPLSTTSANAHRFVSCVKCSSFTHIHCVSSLPSSSYICPCSNPNFNFFPVPEYPVDEKLAKVLLCACKITSTVLKKQLNMSKIRTERAVKEAALARKKTKEAIEHCFALQRLEGSVELANNNMGQCKNENLNGFVGEGISQLQNGPLNNKIGTNGVTKIEANGDGGRIGNNGGGRFGSTFKASAF